jgi:hypothetical protein
MYLKFHPVTPNQRVENNIEDLGESQGQQMSPSQDDAGVLVPTGQRVADSIPMNDSDHPQF